MKLRVVFVPRARKQYRVRLAWWKANRPAAEPLPAKLRRALRLLTSAPNIGSPRPHPEAPGLRLYSLRGTPYAIYYELDVEAQKLRIVAFWSPMQGKGPPL